MDMTTEELTISTAEETVVDVTGQVQTIVDDSELTQGICIVYCPHATASITINQNDADLHDDLLDILSHLVSTDNRYAYTEESGETVAPAHLKTMLLGSGATIPIMDNVLALGTWQSVLLVETAGPEDRTVIIHLHGQ